MAFEMEFEEDDVRMWVDTDGGLTIKAVTAHGDPVELTTSQARRMAAHLVEMADAYDAD